jgi:hypothetical protein
MPGIAISESDRVLILADVERLRARLISLSDAARLDIVAAIFAGNAAVIGVWPVHDAPPQIVAAVSHLPRAVVCTENPVRVDDVMESPKLAG